MLSLIPPILFLFAGAIASPVAVPQSRAPIDYCANTTSITWTIADFKSNVSDTVGTGGTASFKLINQLTGDTDELTCKLQVNYRCIIAGTPSDQNLTIHVGVRAGSLTLGLDKIVECPGRETPVHIIGYNEPALECVVSGEIGGSVNCELQDKDDEDNTFVGEPLELAPGQR
ncbi:hypothetical protein QBC35DRAFT_39273 [Podospora australis]|uniref:AA1-like domain-containing protein n=1 Tax=Podospora australis TaxID=1536484 RepID=A0AAN6WR27_9PEZI|nr:hypothetical protein QBC35DRAFT_39273 [Podospora australis]